MGEDSRRRTAAAEHAKRHTASTRGSARERCKGECCIDEEYEGSKSDSAFLLCLPLSSCF